MVCLGVDLFLFIYVVLRCTFRMTVRIFRPGKFSYVITSGIFLLPFLTFFFSGNQTGCVLEPPNGSFIFLYIFGSLCCFVGKFLKTSLEYMNVSLSPVCILSSLLIQFNLYC